MSRIGSRPNRRGMRVLTSSMMRPTQSGARPGHRHRGTHARQYVVRTFEPMVYDEHAQPKTTFAEYLLPTATELPPIDVILVEYPSKTNPLGVKGAGETACVPVPAAIVAAVENALAPFGVRLAEFPLSPAGICRMIHDARVKPGSNP